MLRGLPLAVALFALAAPARAQEEGPRIALGGDVLYDAPLAYQMRHRAREVGRAQAYGDVFADLAPSLRSADLAIVNLETPVSPRYRSRDAIEDLPVFSAPEDFLDALREAGVDALTVANNHAYDQGVRGLRNTMRALDRRSLAAIGAGDDPAAAARAIVLEHGRARVAVAAWTEGTNHRPRTEEGSRPRIAFLRDGTIAQSLRAARAEAHLVIAVFHWTHEDLVHPRAMMRAVAREAAEAGADLVVGHGTHVPGRTEILETSDGRRVHVLYSLGNLVAAMEEPAGTLASREVGVRDAPLAIVRTRWRGARLAIASVELMHHWIARPVSAPWLEGGRIPISRTVSIDAELARIDRADCGEDCAARAWAYRRRVTLTRDAMRPIAPREVVDEGPSAPALASALEVTPPTSTRAGRSPASARATATPRAADERGPIAPRAESAPAATPREARATAPRSDERERSDAPRHRIARAERARIAEGDPRLAPYLRGVALDASFRDSSARESTIDAQAIARVAALMREDHSLRCEVIAVAPERELASLRARRVKGLIAIRGPSRARFVTRDRQGERASVHLRLFR